MKADYTHLIFVLDRSGSMSSAKDDTIGGFNAFVEEQRAVGGECTLSLYQFDHEVDNVYERVPLDQVEPRTASNYVPRGMTALLDAVGYAIVREGMLLSALPEVERPAHVVMVIMTDGQENSSKEYQIAKVKKMVEHQQRVYAWGVVFLGASLDAVQVGASLGVSRGTSAAYNPGNMKGTFAATSKSVTRSRRGGSLSYTDAERGSMSKGKS